MHLKGDKELKAEELYTSLENEYSTEFDKYADFCKDLDIKDAEDIMRENLRQLVIFNTLQVLFNMNMDIDDIEMFLELSKNGKLLSSIGSTLLTIDKMQIEIYLRKFVKTLEVMKK